VHSWNLSGTVIREDMGFTLEKASTDVLGSAAKVVITKDSTLLVTDGSTREAIEKRVNQIKILAEVQRKPDHCIILE
jgi:chaperonin GroEL